MPGLNTSGYQLVGTAVCGKFPVILTALSTDQVCQRVRRLLTKLLLYLSMVDNLDLRWLCTVLSDSLAVLVAVTGDEKRG